MGCDVFERVLVNTLLRGGTEIFWDLQPNTRLNGPLYFYVEYSRSGQDWVVLNPDSPVIDDCMYTDYLQHAWEKELDYYYRIRVHDADEGIYTSEPYMANSYLDRDSWLKAREIVRQEYLQHRAAAVDGLLFKKKKFGTKCAACVDWDNDTVSNSKCKICFGVGIVGGFYCPIEYTIMMVSYSPRQYKRDENIGMTNNRVQKGRAVAFPWIDTEDFFVSLHTDKRWVLRAFETAVAIKDVPIIFNIELRVAPITDIIFDIPRECTPQSSSSDVPAQITTPSAQASWRDGMAVDDW